MQTIEYIHRNRSENISSTIDKYIRMIRNANNYRHMGKVSASLVIKNTDKKMRCHFYVSNAQTFKMIMLNASNKALK
jgi:hypothetical protein